MNDKIKFSKNLENEPLNMLIQLHIKDYIKLNEINIKKDTLAKYGKGNERRKRLLKKNLEKINDTSTSNEEKYLLTIVNDILELVIDTKNNKLGIILLAMYFINKDNIKNFALNKYYYSPNIQKTINELFEYMDFYSFTYFSKDKIYNSLAIVLYGLLVKHMKQDRLESIQYINKVLNTNFDKSELPTRIRADYLDKYHPYCAGIYNSIPIYQLYTGAKESYYNEEDLNKITQFLKFHLQDNQVLKYINKNSLQYIQEILENKEKLLDTLNKFHLYYALNPISLTEHLKEENSPTKLQLFFKNPKITIKSAINRIFSIISTKLTT